MNDMNGFNGFKEIKGMNENDIITLSDYILFSNNSYLKKKDVTKNCDMYFQHVTQTQKDRIRDISIESTLIFNNSPLFDRNIFGRGNNAVQLQAPCFQNWKSPLNKIDCAQNFRAFNNSTRRH